MKWTIMSTLRDPNQWKRFALIFLIGLLLNVWVLGYLIAVVVFSKQNILDAPQEALKFMINPANVAETFFWGADSQDDLKSSVYKLYSHGTVQAIYWVCFTLLLIRRYMVKGPGKKAADKIGSHGSARWATKAEIRKRFTKDEKGFIVGKSNFQKKLIQPVQSSLNQLAIIFGGSGSGKSTSFVIPNILHISEHLRENLVISDPKGELYNTTAPTLKKRGYEVWAFNLLDMKKSHRYNPMDYVTSPREARSLSQTIIDNTSNPNKKGGDDFFEKAERNLLTALILYVKEQRPKEEQHLASVLEIGTTLGRDEDLLDEMFKPLQDSSPAKRAFKIFNQAVDRTRASILIGFGNRLELWADDDVIELTATSDISLYDLGDLGRKVALYMMTPTQDSTFNVLPAIMIQQLFQELYKKAERMPGNRLSTPVRMILDELANIAPISNLKLMMATMRGYGISAFLIFQSKSQFEDRYGKQVAQEIIDSCDTRLLLGTNDLETKKYFSEDLGTTTIEVDSISQNKDGKNNSSGRSQSLIERKLQTPDEIGRLDIKKLIIFQRAHYPVIANKAWIPKKEFAQIPKTHWFDDIPSRPHGEVQVYIPKSQSLNESLFPKP